MSAIIDRLLRTSAAHFGLPDPRKARGRDWPFELPSTEAKGRMPQPDSKLHKHAANVTLRGRGAGGTCCCRA